MKQIILSVIKPDDWQDVIGFIRFPLPYLPALSEMSCLNQIVNKLLKLPIAQFTTNTEKLLQPLYTASYNAR